jgi:hypothetical protein
LFHPGLPILAILAFSLSSADGLWPHAFIATLCLWRVSSLRF